MCNNPRLQLCKLCRRTSAGAGCNSAGCAEPCARVKRLWWARLLARSTGDLLELADSIATACASLNSLDEPRADTTTPAGKMVLTVFSGIAEFKRDSFETAPVPRRRKARREVRPQAEADARASRPRPAPG